LLILPSFHLILTSGPIFIAKNHQRVVFSWWMLLRQVIGVCPIRILKNIGNPYYEPTIVVHDTYNIKLKAYEITFL